MKKIKLHIMLVVNVALISTSSVMAETLNEKVARNAANCVTGHSASNSPEYQSGEAGKYVLLIGSIVGDEQVLPLLKKTSDRLKASASISGGTIQEEGAWLIQTYCPGIDEIIADLDKS